MKRPGSDDPGRALLQALPFSGAGRYRPGNRARVRSGMANAAAAGKRIGRPQTTIDDIPASFLRHYPAYINGAFNLVELARLCNISRTTAYKYLGLLEG